MSYDIGSTVDLSHINSEASSVQKKSFQEAVENAYSVGTQFIFKQGKAFRKIPVNFA